MSNSEYEHAIEILAREMYGLLYANGLSDDSLEEKLTSDNDVARRAAQIRVEVLEQEKGSVTCLPH